MNESNSTQSNCGCENNECCPPKKKPGWMKYISILVLLIALGIIFYKVFTNNTSGKPSGTEAAVQSSCCDTTAKNDTSAKSCCPKK